MGCAADSSWRFSTESAAKQTLKVLYEMRDNSIALGRQYAKRTSDSDDYLGKI